MKNEITVNTMVDKIYEIINKDIVHYQLRKNIKKWMQICCALDLIRDAEEGFCSFLTKQDYSDGAEQYIYIYGIFQLLQTQQDAFSFLFELLTKEQPRKKNRHLSAKVVNDIRTMRSQLVAHPTEQTKDKNTKIGFITRDTLKDGKFKYSIVTTSDQGEKVSDESDEIDLKQCIQDQSHEMVEKLKVLIQTVQEKYMQDMTDIKNQLQGLPESLNRHVKKLIEFANNHYCINNSHNKSPKTENELKQWRNHLQQNQDFQNLDEDEKDKYIESIDTSVSFDKPSLIIHLNAIKNATTHLYNVITKHFNDENFLNVFSTLNHALNELSLSFENPCIAINSNLLIIFAEHIEEKIDILTKWVRLIYQEFELNDFQSINPSTEIEDLPSLEGIDSLLTTES